MLRWLSRYIRRVAIFGVEVELREPPPIPGPPPAAANDTPLDQSPSSKSAHVGDPPITPRIQPHHDMRAEAGIEAPSDLQSPLAEWPPPLDIARVVPERELVIQIRDALGGIKADGMVGGITIGKPSRPRGLVYVGQCPLNLDAVIRNLAKPHGYNVSVVRSLSALRKFTTASGSDPMNY
jgi:hypothetical protein